MKLKNKIAAAFFAATVFAGALPLPVFAQGANWNISPLSDTEKPAETEAPADTTPALGSGAFSGGYSVSRDKVKKDDSSTFYVTTYIPINNFTDGLTELDFDTRNIFAVASPNASFNPLTAYSWSDECKIVGSFLCVTSQFIDVVYLGEGNTFSYSICYSVGNASVNAPISVSVAECEEYKEPEEEKEDPKPAASFTLEAGTAYSVKAGDSQTITARLKALNSGVFSAVTASLSSGSASVIVEETGSKTSHSAAPQFNFRISVPETAAAGTYNLTLSTAVYSKDGTVASQESYTIPVTVSSDVVSSGLSVSSYKISKEPVKSGDSFTLTLTLENQCKIDLQDVKVSLEGLDSTKFVLDGGFSSQSVSIAAGKKGKVTFPLVACAGISNVRESIPVKAEYRINPADPATVQSLSTSVVAECAPEGEKQEAGKYDISMTGYSFSSSAVKSGTKFSLSFTLKNTSKNDINGARVSVMELNGSKFAVDSGLTYADFDLKAGKSKTFSFQLVGCEGIASIREVIPLEISFGQQASTVYTTVTCVPPEKKEDEDEKDTVFAPAIIIENYDFGGEYVTGGVSFPLSLTVKNTGSSASIENLKITVNGGPGNGDNGVAFSPANSSNSFFIESLGTKATTDISLELLPRADANPDSYPVIVTFEYEYIHNGKREKAQNITETITIPLQQEDRFTINQPDYPESTGLGETAYISASFINKGKSSVYNVTADFVGEGFDKSSGSYYIGNVASGSEEYYDVQITPNTEGQISGEIVVTYEDANGTEKEQRVPVTMNVVSYNYGNFEDVSFDDPGMMGEEMMTEEEGGLTWLWFVIGGAVVVIVAVIVIIAVVKKRKKKRELESDDEDI